MKTIRWLTLTAAASAAAACLVISPLDELNDTSASGGAGAGGAAGGTGGSGGDGSAGRASCTTHDSCSVALGGDEPARCVDGVCQAIKSTQCRCVPNVSSEIWRNDSSILIAAFAPLGTGVCGDDVISKNYRLAIEQINVKAGGLPGPGGTRRPLAIVLCDNGDGMDPTMRRNTVRAGMDHVTTTLNVPAVLAYVEPGDLVDSFSDFGETKGVFFLNPGGVTDSIAATPSPYLWSMLGRTRDVAPTYGALLAALELQNVQEKLEDPAGTKLRVTLLTGESSAEVDLADAVREQLFFNGQNVDDNKAAGFYEEVPIADPSGSALEILDFKPHVVVSASAGNIFALYDNVDTGYHPYYILSPYDQGGLADIADSVNGALVDPGIPGLDETIFGVNAASSEDTKLLLDYTGAYGAKYGAPPGLDSGENLYDAVYYLAYAMLAGADLAALSGFGGAINEGMEDITLTGVARNVGVYDMNDAMKILSQGGQIRLQGTLGPPEYFDQQTNIRRSTGAVYCLAPPNGSTVPVQPHFHVAHFDGPEAGGPLLRLAKQWQGTVPPPCLGWLDLPKQ